MKKQILIALLPLLLASCRKPSEDMVAQTYPLVISTKNIHSELPVTKSASVFNSVDSLLNNLGVLNYLVFDATGKFVHKKKQVKGDESFGEITDELKVGQYTVILLSSTGDLTIGSALTTLSSTKIMSTATSGDIFYKKLSVNITPQGVTESVLLDRMVGCVQVRVTDRVADNISRIELLIENETPFLNINTGDVETVTKEARSVSANVNASNRTSFSLSLLIMNNQAPIIASLKFFDASNNMITTKKLPAITNARGQKVSAEGKLSEFMSVGFTIGYNNTWPSDSTIVYF
jgi:hypothetical protein